MNPYDWLKEKEARIRVDPEKGCLIWTGAISNNYPVARVEGAKKYVHRHVCELEHGPPFPGAEASHLCHNPACVNPKHLIWETKEENQARENHRKPNARKSGLKWYSRFRCGRSRRTSPGFETEKEAHRWYESQTCPSGPLNTCLGTRNPL